MTTTAITTDHSAIIADFSGGSTGATSMDVAMMIGIGLVKNSEAVFFQYLTEDQEPSALMMPSGKPLTRLANVTLAGVDIADDIGEFKSTKLNVYLESNSGRVVLLTSGLTTVWSQCLMTALMGMFNDQTLDKAFSLDSWRGNSKMRPCFAAIRQGNVKVSDQMMYDQLRDLRADRATDKLLSVMRDAAEILNNAVTGGSVEPVTVTEETVVAETDLF